ncbi:hypothetical protein HYALB_00004693 [Hymenoscyphus albidus]|uniref:Acyl-CoA dehydrogenase n=1 Tax=Hymenoscyphus albidus TaxID=595503 RepID=A0A9N9LNX5_9HELO|nr:hypothetical protein HYALB_00004693 [Hymenoscyphus albidus]
MIDFSLTPRQTAIRSSAQEFATTTLLKSSSLTTSHPDPLAKFQATSPLYEAATKAGLIKAQVPETLDGTGGPLIEAALCAEEFYAVEASVSLTILGTGLGLLPLIIEGSDEQHERFLRPFLSEERASLASLVHSEPGGVANFLEEEEGMGLQTVARKEGDEWVINGEKYIWATNCAGWDEHGADLKSVTCRIQGGPPSEVAILIVTREDIAKDPESYKVLKHTETIGHNATSGPHVKFTNLRVPAVNLLAAPGQGAAVIEKAFTFSAALVGAISVGVMRRTFDLALSFAKKDSRNGKVPIIERQSVADLLIDIKMQCEASRALTWKACVGLKKNENTAELAYETKIFCSDSAVKCVVDAMNVVGISSYDADLTWGELLNTAICLPLFDGDNVGVRRRQVERIFTSPDYEPWASTFGSNENE